jgi:general secretion pathway protein I
MPVDRVARNSGFTLLEVVVALAIAGLALVGLFRAATDGIFAVDTAARVEEAVQRAQSHLAAVGRNAALTGGESAGDDGGGYRWTLRVRPVATRQAPGQDGIPSTAATLFDVEVAIAWPARAGERSVTLRTLRLGAAESGG